MMQPEVVTLTLSDVAHGGAAVGRLDNEVIFVPLGMPGEVVAVELYAPRKRYAHGRLVEVLSPSPDRVPPPCPYFGPCGGCQWQHVDYQRQLAFKRHIVATQLRRIGGFPEPPVQPALPAGEPYHYRNNARFSVRQSLLGFTRALSHDFLRIDHCYLMHPLINNVLAALQGRCPPAHQVVIRYGWRTGALAISPPLPEGLIPFPSGQPALTEVLGGLTFQVAVESFFQVNTLGAEALVALVRRALGDEQGSLLLDAYCGVGTFALLLADRAERVIGIEEAASAVKDARANAAAAGLAAKVTFLQGKTERLLPALPERADVVVLDPARVGCHPRVISGLLRQQPRRIVYVSCDPATLARDLKRLCEGAYRLLEVQPVDMFPQTYHIEAVATLALR